MVIASTFQWMNIVVAAGVYDGRGIGRRGDP